MRPHEKHRSEAKPRLSFVVVTVSTSRFQKMKEGAKFSDESGDVAVQLIESSGNSVAGRHLISDTRGLIQREAKAFLKSRHDALVFTGGTGVAKKDVTIEAVRPFFEKELDGFGELLRRVSYDEVGAAAILTRGTAGVSGGKLIVCLPGSPGAVRTGLSSTISEFPHLIHVARQ